MAAPQLGAVHHILWGMRVLMCVALDACVWQVCSRELHWCVCVCVCSYLQGGTAGEVYSLRTNAAPIPLVCVCVHRSPYGPGLL